MTGDPAARSFRSFILHPSSFCLVFILLSSFLLKLNHLGHKAIKPLDEAFHAVVAKNLMSHPLRPTLNEGITIPTQPGDWQNGEIWLHKPPMSLWQIAISFKLLGVDTFVLRLPSAILSTLAVLLTYLIGARLMNPIAGLVAAGLQAFNPAIIGLVHGYIFSDHVDISLLFWTELAIYFLIRGIDTSKWSDFALCGIAQGLAFLSKTYPALIVTGLAVVAWAMPGLRMSLRRLGILLVATLLTIAPWTIWALVHWPQLYVQETLHVFRHLTENIEDWAAPWDRLPFDHWVQAFHVFYPAVLSGVIITLIHAKQTRDPKLWLVLAWAAGVAVPHLLATSKPPVGTLIGWPAMWLTLGYMVSRAVRGEGVAIGALLVSMLSPILLAADNFRAGGIGSSAPASGEMLRQHSWVLWHTFAAIIAGILLWKLRNRRVQIILLTSALLAAVFIPTLQHLRLAWRTTEQDRNEPSFENLARFIQTLPNESVLLVDEQTGGENKAIQFVTGRTCYPVHADQLETMAAQVRRGGGLPILITPAETNRALEYFDQTTGRRVYRLLPN